MSNEEYMQILKTKYEEFKENWKTNPKGNASWSDFDKLRILGRGGFGRVFLVKHKKTGTFYALKALSKIEIVKTKQIQNAITEKKMLACVNFPFLLNMTFSFKDNSYLYMVLQFVIGGEMFQMLKVMKHFPDTLVRFYSCQVILALEYLHFMSIVYRDLKPENILINGDGYLKVADFGFAKLIPPGKRTWTLCGTPDYMAPETVLNKGYHCAVDWWALGVLLFEMSAGFPPFMAKDELGIYENIVSRRLRFTKHFSPELRDLVNNLVQADLSKRYGNLSSGVNDIKSHSFYSGIDWMMVYRKAFNPPYQPKLKGPGDTSCFCQIQEEELTVADTDKYANDFLEF